MRADRWELGGDFPTPRAGEHAGGPGERLRDLFPGARLFGSGRAALLALLEAGRRSRGWTRVLLPSYLCREVREAVERARFPWASYGDAPDARPAGLPARVEPGDVLLRLNPFGWRGLEERDRAPAGADVIEDHTHDPTGPWARASRASFALASLRKTCPLPDGAVLWSPAGLALPDEPGPTDAHLGAAELKAAAMRLKRHYLEGRPVEKRSYTPLLAAGEARLGLGEPSGPHPDTRAALETLALVGLAAARRRGFERLVAAPGFPVAWLAGRAPEGGHPFGVVLDLGTRRRRERVKAALWRERVFTHVLWELPSGADERARAFSERTLVMACDSRYADEDLDRAAEVVARVAAGEARRETGILAPIRRLLGG